MYNTLKVTEKHLVRCEQKTAMKVHTAVVVVVVVVDMVEGEEDVPEVAAEVHVVEEVHLVHDLVAKNEDLDPDPEVPVDLQVRRHLRRVPATTPAVDHDHAANRDHDQSLQEDPDLLRTRWKTEKTVNIFILVCDSKYCFVISDVK